MLSSYLQSHPYLLNHGASTNRSRDVTATSHGTGATVLELGAAAGLPSLTAASLGARKVVATDYPDLEVIENLKGNVERNQVLWRTGVSPAANVENEKQNPRQDVLNDFDDRDVVKKAENGNEVGTLERRADLGSGTVVVHPYLWGSNPKSLLAHLPDSGNGNDDDDGNSDPRTKPDSTVASNGASTNGTNHKQNTKTKSCRPKKGFDLILMADLLYNHSCHENLLRTIKSTLARPSRPPPPSIPPNGQSPSITTTTSSPLPVPPPSSSPQHTNSNLNPNPSTNPEPHPSHPHTNSKPYPRALIFFTPYRPWLLDRDLAFFDLCRSSTVSSEENQDQHGTQEREEHLTVRKILEVDMGEVMFQDDPGDERLRRTCFAYEVFWSRLDLEAGN